MPTGLLIDLNDGRPMVITAGMRAAIYVADVSSAAGRFTIPGGISAGDQFIWMIDEPVNMYFSGAILHVNFVRSVQVSGNQIWCVRGSSNVQQNNTEVVMAGQIWKISGASQSSNTGLLIADSTDFTIIPTGATVGSCIYYDTITFTGTWTIPSNGVVFAYWDNAGVVLERYGNKLYCKKYNDSAVGDPGDGTVTIRVAVFANVRPQPGPGLNFFNAAGECTFSTASKPLIIQSLYSPSESFQAVNGMIMISTNGWYSNSGNGKGYYMTRRKGLRMSGGNVMVARGSYWGQNYTDYAFNNQNGVLSQLIPVIPNFY
ncbi:DUF6453 family protein [Phytobacter ursingii]|uniref:DUF6453 family protein n=1 Tax=Phytobacter ursingii TaxID=1972431 RepID=A0AB35RSF5_9ENTR|nr:DUF6453 family protein [Phytobacter ursingii]MDV2864950.1 DUF6453 family protein [Phytobacter ursingii]